LSSIKHAGALGLGLTEVRVLMENSLRCVLLRVDGGFKSGWDVIMGGIDGAEEYAAIAMIAGAALWGCHTNNCPVVLPLRRRTAQAVYRVARAW